MSSSFVFHLISAVVSNFFHLTRKFVMDVTSTAAD